MLVQRSIKYKNKLNLIFFFELMENGWNEFELLGNLSSNLNMSPAIFVFSICKSSSARLEFVNVTWAGQFCKLSSREKKTFLSTSQTLN